MQKGAEDEVKEVSQLKKITNVIQKKERETEMDKIEVY